MPSASRAPSRKSAGASWRFCRTSRSSRAAGGAYLRRAIEEGYGPPKGFAQVQARGKAHQAARYQRGEDARRVAEEKVRQSHEKRFGEAFVAFLGEWVTQWEKTQPEARNKRLRRKRDHGDTPWPDENVFSMVF